MSSFPTIIEKQWYHNSVFDIFNDKDDVEEEIETEIFNAHEDLSSSEDEDPEPVPFKFRIELPGSFCSDKGLPTKHDNEHHMSCNDFSQASRVRDYSNDDALKFFIENVDKEELDDEGDIPVSFSTFVMRDYVLSKKLNLIVKAKNLEALDDVRSVKFTQLELAEWVNEIVQMNSGEIEENSIIRDIIDVAFMDTAFFKNVQLTIFMLFHVGPMLTQMFFHTIG